LVAYSLLPVDRVLPNPFPQQALTKGP